MGLSTDSILKTLRMGKFNSCNQWSKAVHLGCRSSLRSASGSSKKSINEICDDIFKITLICRHYNITTIFLSSIAYSTKENLQLNRSLNGLLYNACKKCGFHFVYNGAVSNVTSGKEGIHLLKTGKVIITKSLFSSTNYFLEKIIPPSSSF